MNARAQGASTAFANETLIPLIYELLDAHDDTAQLARESICEPPDFDPPDPRWEAHLEYLRALQRKGRELLAQLPGGSA
jgi:hypothetical protein